MITPLITISAIIAAAVALVFAPLALEVYARYRRRKVVTCPDNQMFTEVTLHAGRAAFGSLFGKSKLTVKSCSRWPRKKGCDEACVAENWPKS
jgi:hypothetical protein